MPFEVAPYVPEYITVHTAPAAQAAEDVTVTFPDYIKNVASSEIYPTWPVSALRANILAQISFALNRVYTEYYPSRGYPFQITGSTQNDQRFIKGRNIFENISRLVDEIFSQYIRRQGFVEPLSARFCNGTTVTCDGLSQWGSEELAQAGYDSMAILRRYYGEDIELVTSAPVAPLRQSYPGYPLREGSSGEEVVVLQTMVNRISRNYPAIPRIRPVDGIFGPMTRQAVESFQSIFGLTQDGVVGRSTWYKMVFLYVGVQDLSELVSQGQTFYQVSFPQGELLSPGDRGERVEQLQYYLSVLAQFDTAIPFLPVDGIYGPRTQEAVRAFQGRYGLTATGVVDQATWDQLYREYAGISADLLDRRDLFPAGGAEEDAPLPAAQFPGADLSLGDRDARS